MSRPRTLAAALVLAALLGASEPAAAQQPRAPAPAPTPTEPDVAPPYEPQLLRLAEILGALSHLRDVCGMKDGRAWRARMEALIAAEGATAQRRERLAGAFNRGFRGYAETHRACTPAAEAAIVRFIEEGTQLSRDVAARYRG